MATKTKKKAAKTAAKKLPAKKVTKKKRSRKRAAAKRLPRVSPRRATREADAEPSDDDSASPHEHLEPRALTHERLHNLPEETAMPALDDDLLDDVAAGADALEGATDDEEFDA